MSNSWAARWTWHNMVDAVQKNQVLTVPWICGKMDSGIHGENTVRRSPL